MAKRQTIVSKEEVASLLSDAYCKNSNVLNKAIRRAYAYAGALEEVNEEEKEKELRWMLNNEHIYVKYWAAVIALSYKLLKKESLLALISILDINPVREDGTINLRLNSLKMEIECRLYDYKKYRCIGSYPGQVAHKPSVMPNAKFAIAYFRRLINMV